MGSAVVHYLCLQSAPIRVVIRSQNKSASFTSRNIEVAIADLTDVNALTKAFQGAKAVFAMNPTNYEGPDVHTDAAKVGKALAAAIKVANVPRVVVLSSIGAERTSGTGNVLTAHITEETLNGTAPQVVLIRCAWFMENWSSSVLAVKSGKATMIESMLQKLDRKISQVATDDIGCVVVEYLTKAAQEIDQRHIIELEGPEPYSPKDVAEIVSKLLGENVAAVAMTEEMTHELFENFGWPKATADNWIEMVQGFDSNTICWTTNENVIRKKGTRTLEEVLTRVLK